MDPKDNTPVYTNYITWTQNYPIDLFCEAEFIKDALIDTIIEIDGCAEANAVIAYIMAL